MIGVTYLPSPQRYDSMTYRRSGRSGLQLPFSERRVHALEDGPERRALRFRQARLAAEARHVPIGPPRLQLPRVHDARPVWIALQCLPPDTGSLRARRACTVG